MPRLSVVAAFVLLALTPLVYRGVWSAGFVYEDWNAVGHSEPQGFAIQPLRVRSLTRASYRLDRWLGDNQPAMYHLTNLGLHIANGGLVMGLAIALGVAPGVAVLAGTIFLLHPMQTEAVDYIAGRTEVLSTCLVLLGCLAIVRERWWLAAAPFVLAMMAKESAVVGIGLFALLHFVRTGTIPRQLRQIRLYLLCSLPIALMTATVFRYEYRPGGRSVLSLFEYMRLQATAVWSFLGAILLPLPRFFSIDHDFEIVPTGWQTLAFWTLVWAACGVGFLWLVRKDLWKRRDADWIPFGLIWFGIAISPRFVMRIPEVLNEHQLYLGMVGISLALAQAIGFLTARRSPCFAG